MKEIEASKVKIDSNRNQNNNFFIIQNISKKSKLKFSEGPKLDEQNTTLTVNFQTEKV